MKNILREKKSKINKRNVYFGLLEYVPQMKAEENIPQSQVHSPL